MLANLFEGIHNNVWRLLPFMAVFAFFALINFQLDLDDITAYLISTVAAVIFVLMCTYIFRLKAVNRYFLFFGTVRFSFFAVLLMGLSLRLLWYFTFPMEPTSDSVAYLSLANLLVSESSYIAFGTKAYWPPGFPLFLYITHLGMFDVTTTSITVINFLMYVLSSFAIYNLTLKVCNEKAAMIALIGLALWPNHIANIGVPFKEYLVFTVLLLAVWMYVSSQSFLLRFLTGIFLGLCALAQPGTIFFVSVFLVSSWYQKESLKTQVLSIVGYVLGVFLVITPWTYRNMQVFDEFVFISTNGGSNLYRANNELAEGGYMSEGKVVLVGESELEENRKYKALAVEWITNNPSDFLKLSFRKIILFLGDDSTGVYTSMKRSAVKPSNETTYYIAKLLSSLFWLIMWLILIVRMKTLKTVFMRNKILIPISLSFLYFLTVHSVFESNSKYHFPASWALLIICSVVLVSDDTASSRKKVMLT